jgi:hypothetical protein
MEPDSAIGGLLQSYPANPVQHPELNPELSDIQPNLENIIAFVNPKSGGQKGRIVFERLKNYLHKDNVFDLTKGGPRPGLEKHKDNKELRVIACGGDGTVGWWALNFFYNKANIFYMKYLIQKKGCCQ